LRWPKLPLTIIPLDRYEELQRIEKEHARLSKIVMLVEHVELKDEIKHRQILFRSELGMIPGLLQYSNSMPYNTMRLFGLPDTLMMFPTGDSYDILFMEA
jgi:hypothetical protein